MANDNSNNLGSTIFKIVALAGGALTGAIIASWFDKRLNNMANDRSDYDKSRYAQGLAPREPAAINAPSTQNERPHIIRVEQPEYQNWSVEETDEEH